MASTATSSERQSRADMRPNDSDRPSARSWSLLDVALVDAGAEGELLVARVRLVLGLLLLLAPISSTIENPGLLENWIGVGACVITITFATFVYVAARRGVWRTWVGYLTSSYDVTMVSLVLASFFLIGRPHVAVNSRVVFEFYFIAIAATCLRYDQKICRLAGTLAVAQYGLIIWAADHFWELNDSARFGPFDYGRFSIGDQLARLVLLGVASIIASTIVVRARRLRQLSIHDGLTGLVNRTFFVQRLREELQRTRRTARPLTLALIDLDHFKAFNDSFGHQAGDEALRLVARTLRESLRGTDVVGRYGGEEFVVLMPDTSTADAERKLDAVREQLAGTELHFGNRPMTGRLTMSAGVAGPPADGDSPDALLRAADARLFAAKHAGRNCVLGPGPALAVAT